MKKKLLIAVVVLVLLSGAVAVTWNALGMPPVRLVLAYGYPSPMGPTGRTVEIEGVEFVEISPGYFRMGSHYLCEKGDLLGRLGSLVGCSWGTSPRHDSDECPPHWVEFEDGFWIARTEVTNSEFENVDPGHERVGPSDRDRCPAVDVSWFQVTEYCSSLAKRSGLPVRLPTEAEWECSCRAGSSGEFCFGDDVAELPEYAWFDANSQMDVRPVGTRRGNGWGLHDLHGLALEWCEDTRHWGYIGAPADGSAWTEGGLPRDGTRNRVLRGGYFLSVQEACRSAARLALPPYKWDLFIGFRPAFTLTTDAEREVLRRHIQKKRKLPVSGPFSH